MACPGSSQVEIPKGLSLGSAGGTLEGTWLSCLGIANVLLHTQNALQAQSRIALASFQRLSHPAPSHLFHGEINTCYCTGLLSLSSNGISKKEQRKTNQRWGWEPLARCVLMRKRERERKGGHQHRVDCEQCLCLWRRAGWGFLTHFPPGLCSTDMKATPGAWSEQRA